MEKRKEVKDILEHYSGKIESQISSDNVTSSREYITFRGEMVKQFSSYEKWCKSLGSFIKLKISTKELNKMQPNLKIAHLNVEPWQALGLSVMTFLSIFFLGLIISVAVVLIRGNIIYFPFLFFFLSIILAVFLFYFIKSYPQRLANKWRLKASSQMVPAILYIVVYMRHTPNLEKAVGFASEHLEYPLALDFKKIFYDVEVGRFPTIKESLDYYLETWRNYSPEFIESFHLIESSLFEPDNTRRIASLEKALQVVLDGVHDRMLRFTHTVRSPLNNVYMLGVVLPTLALALIPLASAMIGEFIKWYHIIILFNMIIPFFVFYLTDKVLALRPGGYGETALLERNPLYPEFKSKKPYLKALLICLPLLIIGLLPLMFQIFSPLPVIGIERDFTFSQIGLSFLGEESVLGFISTETSVSGPFGLGALIASLFLTLGVALFFAISYSMKTKRLIKEREKTRELEREFNNSLFQLGNRIGNGTPPEIAFGLSAESSKGLNTEDFFKRVNYNIRQMGMSVDKAIFDPRRGAIIYYPSQLIATSMRVLVESSKKGLKIAANSLMSISEYVKNIHKITDRLRDMLAETIADMRSNMTFLAPLLSGVVVGLAAMITTILSKLQLDQFAGENLSAAGSYATITSLFELTKMIPPYYLQIAIGIYLIQIIFILTSALVTIDSGEDKLYRTNETSKNLKKGIILFFFTAFITSIVLFFLASFVLSGL